MKKTLLSIAATTLCLNASAANLENYLNHITEDKTFTCSVYECHANDIELTENDSVFKIGKIELLFNENIKNFDFDVDAAIKNSKKECSNSAEYDFCLDEKTKEKTQAQTKTVFGNLITAKAFGIEVIESGKKGTVELIEFNNRSISSNIANKDILDITPNDLSSRFEIHVKNMEGEGVTDEIMDNIENVLPRTELTREATNIEFREHKTTFITEKLEEVTKMNKMFTDQFTILIEEFNKNNKPSKNIDFVFETTTSLDTLIITASFLQETDKGLSGSGDINFMLRNINKNLNILKEFMTSEQPQSNPMAAVQDFFFNELNLHMNITKLKEIHDKMLSNKEYGKRYSEIVNTWESDAFQEEFNLLNEIEKTEYKSLLLKHNEILINVSNPKQTPLISMIMGAIGGNDIFDNLKFKSTLK